jgi:hypothetical protein
VCSPSKPGNCRRRVRRWQVYARRSRHAHN